MEGDLKTDSLSELKVQVERASLRLAQLNQQCDDAQERLAQVRSEINLADRHLASLQVMKTLDTAALTELPKKRQDVLAHVSNGELVSP
ncbi:MAG: hypothetical protein ABI672_19555 [Vicinamibacteria bacterium]